MNKMASIKTNKFNIRSFVAIAMCISGLLLPISGTMNHLLQFGLLTQKIHFWMSIHNMSGLLFTIFAIFHIILNRTNLVNYVNSVKTNAISKEAIIAMLFVIILVGLAALHTLFNYS